MKFFSNFSQKIVNRQFEVFFLNFSQKMGFDFSCKLSPQETICIKCQSLFSGKNKKNISNYYLLKLPREWLKVKYI